MSKTLSNGTLGLRFMQNAQRTKNPHPPEVKPEHGNLPDDAEWQVPQNVRDAWNSASGVTATNSNNSAVVSEPSYLPFLFHSEDKPSPSFKGRRSFAHGKEVVQQEPEPVQSSDPQQPTVTKIESASVSGGENAGPARRDNTLVKVKGEKRPASISGFRSSVSVTSPAPILPGKKPALPSTSLIYQDADVGVDLSSARRAARHRTGFMKPADVDTPPQLSESLRKPTVLSRVGSDGSRVEQKKSTTDDSDSSTQDSPEDPLRKKRKK